MNDFNNTQSFLSAGQLYDRIEASELMSSSSSCKLSEVSEHEEDYSYNSQLIQEPRKLPQIRINSAPLDAIEEVKNSPMNSEQSKRSEVSISQVSSHKYCLLANDNTFLLEGFKKHL